MFSVRLLATRLTPMGQFLYPSTTACVRAKQFPRLSLDDATRDNCLFSIGMLSVWDMNRSFRNGYRYG